ncbi:TetR/AcrR family transcriptional regulator [Rathayibacter sp. CAU 1779]
MSPDPPRSRMSPERLAELFAAVHELLLEVGYERLTLDGVAARAHASKATLYRQWGSKSGLVMAALTFAGAQHRPLLGDAGAASLDEAFAQMPGAELVSDGDLRMGFMLLQAASSDPEFATALRNDIIAPRVSELAEIFEAAADRGEIVRDSPLFQRLAYLVLTDLAFFPLLNGQSDDQAASGDLFRRIIRPALTFTDSRDGD